MTEPTGLRYGEPGSDEWVTMDSIEKHLLIVFVNGEIPHIQTKHTVPGKRSNAIQVDIIDLNLPGEDGQPGKVLRKQNWMSGPVIQVLRDSIGLDPRLGALSRKFEPTREEPRPPWQFRTLTGSPQAVAAADEWAARNPGFKRSDFTQPVPPPPLPPAPSQQQPAQGYGGWGPQQPPQTPPPQWGPPPQQPAQQPQWGPPPQQPAPQQQPQWGPLPQQPPAQQPQWAQPQQPQQQPPAPPQQSMLQQIAQQQPGQQIDYGPQGPPPY